MSVGVLSFGTVRTLQFVTATGIGPSALGSAAVTTVNATSMISRSPFVIGSGDVSQIVLSFFAWYLQKLVGVTALGNGLTVNSCSIEYNGTSQPVTFSGGRTLTVNSGDTDIHSDPLFASSFGLGAFTQGSTGYIRLSVSFGAAQTDKFPLNSYTPLNASTSQLLYDPNKCTITNGIDSTGAITFSMTNGGVNGADAVVPSRFYTPIVLGRFVSAGRKPSFITAGDSIASGSTVDTVSNAVFAMGYSQFYFPNGVSSATGAIANLNMACPGGIGSDWTGGSTSLLTAYLQYAKYAVEAYGANNATASFSTAIWTQLAGSGISSIFRVSLTPSTSSNDNWTDAAGQSYAANYGPASSIATFDSTLKALVSATITYLDPLGMRDQAGAGDYWKWASNGTNFYACHSDGLHPTSVAYGLMGSGNTTVTAIGGVTTNTLPALLAAQT